MRALFVLLLFSVVLQPGWATARQEEKKGPGAQVREVIDKGLKKSPEKIKEKLESKSVRQLDKLTANIFREYPIFTGVNLGNFKKYADDGKLPEAIDDLRTLADVTRKALFEEKYGSAFYDLSKFTITKIFPGSKYLFNFGEGYAKAFEEINAGITGNNLAYIRNAYYRHYDNNCRKVARRLAAEGLKIGNSLSQVTTLVEMRCEADDDKVKQETLEYIEQQGMFTFYGQGDIAYSGGGYVCSGLGSWLKSSGRLTKNLQNLVNSPNTAANECETAAKLFLSHDPLINNYPKKISHYFKYVAPAKPLFDKLKKIKAMAKAIREADRRYQQLKSELLAEQERKKELYGKLTEHRKSGPTVTRPEYQPKAGEAGRRYDAKLKAERLRISKWSRAVTDKFRHKKEENWAKINQLRTSLPKPLTWSRLDALENAPADPEIDPLMLDYNRRQVDDIEPIVKYGHIKAEALGLEAEIVQAEIDQFRELIAVDRAFQKLPDHGKRNQRDPIPQHELMIELKTLDLEKLNNQAAAVTRNISAYSQRQAAYQQAIDEGTRKLEELQASQYQPAKEEYQRASQEAEKTWVEINELVASEPLEVKKIARRINQARSPAELADLNSRVTAALNRYDKLSSLYQGQVYRMDSSAQQANAVLKSAEIDGAGPSYSIDPKKNSYLAFSAASGIERLDTWSTRAFLANMDVIIAANQRLIKEAGNLFAKGERLLDGLAFQPDAEFKTRSSRLAAIINAKPRLLNKEEKRVNGELAANRPRPIASGKRPEKKSPPGLKLGALLTRDAHEALANLAALNQGLQEARLKHKQLLNQPVSFTIERLGSLTGEAVNYVMSGGRPFLPKEEDIEDGNIPLEIVASGAGLLGPVPRLTITVNGRNLPFDTEFTSQDEDLVEAVYTAALPAGGNNEREVFIKTATRYSVSYYKFKLAPQITDFASLRENTQELLNGLLERYRGRDWWGMEVFFHEDDYEGDLYELEKSVTREFDGDDRFTQLRFSINDISHRDGATIALVAWNKGTASGNSQFHLRDNKIVEITGELPFGGAGKSDAVNLRTYVANFTVGDGFDISAGRGVPGGGSSDFEFYGHGSGEVFSSRPALYESQDDFDDMDEAPAGGYQSVISFDDDIAFYVHTTEGHFAKALISGNTIRVVYNPTGGRQLK